MRLGGLGISSRSFGAPKPPLVETGSAHLTPNSQLMLHMIHAPYHAPTYSSRLLRRTARATSGGRFENARPPAPLYSGALSTRFVDAERERVHVYVCAARAETRALGGMEARAPARAGPLGGCSEVCRCSDRVVGVRPRRECCRSGSLPIDQCTTTRRDVKCRGRVALVGPSDHALLHIAFRGLQASTHRSLHGGRGGAIGVTGSPIGTEAQRMPWRTPSIRCGLVR